jgi:hypothetical protein
LIAVAVAVTTALIGAAVKFGSLSGKVEGLHQIVKDMRENFDHLLERFDNLPCSEHVEVLAIHDTKLENHTRRMDAHSTRFENLLRFAEGTTERSEGVAKRLEAVEKKLSKGDAGPRGGYLPVGNRQVCRIGRTGKGDGTVQGSVRTVGNVDCRMGI